MNNIAVKTNTVCKGFGEGETRTEVLKDLSHVSFIKMYSNGVSALEGFPFFYEPKPGYDYKWSGN